jgi:hypothetical protein
MEKMAKAAGDELVLLQDANGYVVIPTSTRLRRLNYFDGKFLRAEDMQAEQLYLRNLVGLANAAGGSGVVNGFDVTLSGKEDAVVVGPGLAIDGHGRALLLPLEKAIDFPSLLADSSPVAATPAAAGADFAACAAGDAKPTAVATPGDGLYLLTVGYVEALCGEEDVFGRLCEDACLTAKDRRFRVEGVVFRAVPLALGGPLPVSALVPMEAKHLRSRIASAYFAGEKNSVGSLISAAGLAAETWCRGAWAAIGDTVPLGVFKRAGTTTMFLDAWTARRERMDTPPRRYWAFRMSMRPWDIYLAQILQFQCQLHDLLTGHGGVMLPPDPCRPVLHQTGAFLDELAASYEKLSENQRASLAVLIPGGADRFLGLRGSVQTALKAPGGLANGQNPRLLINGGIIELPPAGYLPIDVESPLDVQTQVRRWMGEGLDLRFCRVRADFVPHALEEAQHMDRISLLEGIDNPAAKPEVDILVPDGKEEAQTIPRFGFDVGVLVAVPGNDTNQNQIHFAQGAGRGELPEGGGANFYAAALVAPFARAVVGGVNNETHVSVTPSVLPQIVPGQEEADAWVALKCDQNPLTLGKGDSTNVTVSPTVAGRDNGVASLAVEAIASGSFTVGDRKPVANGTLITGELTASATQPGKPGSGGDDALTFDVRILWDGQQAVSVEAIQQLQGGISTNVRTQLVVGLEAGPNSKQPGTIGVRAIVLQAPAPKSLLATNNTIKPGLAATGAPANTSLFALLTAEVASARQATLQVDAFAEIKRDDGIFDATNVSHQRAAAALTAVNGVLAKANRPAVDPALLFPPANTPGAPAALRPTRDWVLFHRRRTKTCVATPKTAPPPALTRYAVFHLTLSAAEGRKLKAAMANGASLASFVGQPDIASRLQMIDTVGFNDGVLPPVEAARLKGAWANAVEPQGNVVAAIVGAGPPESAVQRPDRLALVEQAVAAPLATGSNFSSSSLPEVPAPFTRPDAVGFVLLVTQQVIIKVTTTCAAVFFADRSAADKLGNATAANIASELGKVSPANLKFALAASFSGTTVAVPADAMNQLPSDYKAMGADAPPERAWIFFHTGESDPALAAQRGENLAKVAGQATNIPHFAVALPTSAKLPLTQPGAAACPVQVLVIPNYLPIIR